MSHNLIIKELYFLSMLTPWLAYTCASLLHHSIEEDNKLFSCKNKYRKKHIYHPEHYI